MEDNQLVVSTKVSCDGMTLTKDKTLKLDVSGYDGETILLIKRALEIGLSYGRSENVPQPLIESFNKMKKREETPKTAPSMANTESNEASLQSSERSDVDSEHLDV